MLILTGQYVAIDPEGIFSGVFTWKGVLTAVAGVGVILVFLAIDWKELLLNTRLRLHLRIWNRRSRSVPPEDEVRVDGRNRRLGAKETST